MQDCYTWLRVVLPRLNVYRYALSLVVVSGASVAHAQIVTVPPTGATGTPGAAGATANVGGAGGAGGTGISLQSPNTGLNNGYVIAGGIGGRGGLSTTFYGGNGGVGGTGLTSNVTGAVILNTGSISGGQGGAGGNATLPSGVGGRGGAGGGGVTLIAPSVITNEGTISGGRGGTYGTPSGGATFLGAGGTGVSANGRTTIVNKGTISGGLQGNPGTSRANAISFTGGGNSLELWSTSIINGNVIATAAGGDRLVLSGSTDGTFNAASIGNAAQYRGFTIFEKSGSSNWALTGSTTALTPWNINGGTLSISSDAALGNSIGELTLDGGSLRSTASLSMNRGITLGPSGGGIQVEGGTTLTQQGVISGAGMLKKAGEGTLVLVGENTYTRGTEIAAGTLQIGNGGNSGSIVGNVVNNATLSFNRSNSFTYGGEISGVGAVTQIGAGTTVLTGENTYTGETRISAGTLQLGDGGTTGSIAGNVVNDSKLVLNRSDTFALNGNISGTGSVTKEGDGTVVLAGENTYTGGTTITTGTIQVGNGGSTGSIIGNIANNGVLAVDRAGSLILSGEISGIGSVAQRGAGTTILTADNTFTGNTSISSGTLQLGDGGSTGSIVGNVLNDGTLSFNRADTLAFAGEITGAGAVRQLGTGTTILTGDSTYTGGTSIYAGALQLGDGGISGSIVGGIANNGILALNRSDNLTIDGEIAGSGSVTQIGTGKTILTGQNSYTGGTSIVAGTLQLGDGGTSGAIVGNVLNNGILSFNRSDRIIFSGDISGTGAVEQLGSGITVLTGTNTYSGNTKIAAGILQLGDGGTSGSVAGNILNNGVLAFNHSDTLTLSGDITGTGAVNQFGPGTTVLLGNNSYSGDTTVSEGILAAGSGGAFSNLSAFKIQSGGLTLGEFDSTVKSLYNAGTVSFGPKVGQRLTVLNDYTGNKGAIYFNTVLGSDNSQTDQLSVAGNVLGSTFVKVTNLGGQGAQTMGDGIRLIDVGGESAAGAFSLLSDYQHDGQPAVVGGAYAYKLYQGSKDQSNMQHWYLRSVLAAPETAVVTPLYQAGVGVYESYPQFLLGLNSVSTLQQRTLNRMRIIAPDANTVEKFSLAEGNGVWSRVEWSHNRAKSSMSTSSVQQKQEAFKWQAGVDRRILASDRAALIGGMTLHYANGTGTTKSPYDTSGGGGNVRTNGYGFGGTLTWYANDGFYLDTQAQATWYRSDLRYDGGGKMLKRNNGGFGYSISVEGGKKIAINSSWTLSPQAQLTYSDVRFDNFSDAFGAKVRLERGDSLVSRLGVLVESEVDINSQRYARLYGTANMYYEHLNGQRVNVANVSFSNRNDRARGEIGVGGAYDWNGGLYSIYGETVFNSSLQNPRDNRSLGAKVGFRMRW